MVGGGLVFELAVSLLPFAGGAHEPLWDTAPLIRLPLILTLVCLAAICLAATSLLNGSMLSLALATCCSFWLLGQIFPVGHPTYENFRAGFWLASSMALAMSLGGVLALAGKRWVSPFAKPH